jgi:hypothetical protein
MTRSSQDVEQLGQISIAVAVVIISIMLGVYLANSSPRFQTSIPSMLGDQAQPKAQVHLQVFFI